MFLQVEQNSPFHQSCCFTYALLLSDMVRDILETRAEIYKALNRTPKSDSDEEEGPSQEDIQLEEHLKLKETMAEATGSK